MISNERPSPFRPRSQRYSQHRPPRQPIDERTLHAEQVQVERRSYVFLLRENPRGRFVRIIEEGNRHANSIIIPVTGLEAFHETLAKTLKAAKEMPSEDPAL